MAGMKSIDEARDVLEEAALMTTETVKAFEAVLDAVGSAELPPWLFVLARQIRTWDDAAQTYIMAVHQHARPVLNDMENLSKTHQR